MAFGSKQTKQFTALPVFKGGVRVATLSGADTLTEASSWYQFLDPGGAHGDITLPTAQDGMTFWVFNRADAAENLVIKDAAANTVGTINQNEGGVVAYSGSAWVIHILTAPIA
jgi:hypothetical protein